MYHETRLWVFKKLGLKLKPKILVNRVFGISFDTWDLIKVSTKTIYHYPNTPWKVDVYVHRSWRVLGYYEHTTIMDFEND